MISRQLIKDTIEALELLLDEFQPSTDADKEYLGRVASTLNFWRMYQNFLPEER